MKKIYIFICIGVSLFFSLAQVRAEYHENGKLGLKLRFVESFWGQEKEKLEFLPGEVIYIKCTLTDFGIQDNRYSLLTRIEITNKDGIEVLAGTLTNNKDGRDFFNGAFSDIFTITLPSRLASGNYYYLITIKDLINNTQVSKKGLFTIKKESFSVTNLKFNYTSKEEGTEVPPLFNLGDFAYLHFNIVGLTELNRLGDREEAMLQVGFQILDRTGKELFYNPYAIQKKLSDLVLPASELPEIQKARIGDSINLIPVQSLNNRELPERAPGYVVFKCLKEGSFTLALSVSLIKGGVKLVIKKKIEFEIKM